MSMLRRLPCHLASLGGRVALTRCPVRLRFTVLYPALLLLSGVVLLVIVNVLTPSAASGGTTVARSRAGSGTSVKQSRRSMADYLLDNAILHNDPGGWLRIATEPDADIGTVRLIVEAGGQVLDQRQVEQLAQPFRRAGADRTGSGNGLGLSIVPAIAAAHGGSLNLRARAEGGLRVSVELPLAAGLARESVPA